MTDATTTSPADVLVTAGPVARVTLNRPDRRNALSLGLMRRLTGVLEDLGGRPGVRVIVIAAEGPVFSSGHDLAEMAGADPGFLDELFAACTALMRTVHRVPQPVIARVHGLATAAGCQLVASCDLVVAAEEARFATPGVRIGLFCSTPMVPLSRAVGRKRAMEMLLTGEPIDAATAMEWGLVNRVVPAAGLDAAVDALATRILGASGATVGTGKAAFYDQVERDEDAAYDRMQRVMADNARDADAQEGICAFLDKRPPVWREPGTAGR